MVLVSFQHIVEAACQSLLIQNVICPISSNTCDAATCNSCESTDTDSVQEHRFFFISLSLHILAR